MVRILSSLWIALNCMVLLYNHGGSKMEKLGAHFTSAYTWWEVKRWEQFSLWFPFWLVRRRENCSHVLTSHHVYADVKCAPKKLATGKLHYLHLYLNFYDRSYTDVQMLIMVRCFVFWWWSFNIPKIQLNPKVGN